MNICPTCHQEIRDHSQICRFCTRPATVEGWYRYRDVFGRGNSLLQWSPACDDHKHLLMEPQPEVPTVESHDFPG